MLSGAVFTGGRAANFPEEGTLQESKRVYEVTYLQQSFLYVSGECADLSALPEESQVDFESSNTSQRRRHKPGTS